jgi:two-component system sensor histidine kinase and response regulator WspE
MGANDLSQVSMLDLFRMEAETQGEVLTSGLLALERTPHALDRLEACMRAAHSLKGAARIVGITVGVRVAHALEDCFVAAQRGDLTLERRHIDCLMAGADLLARIATTPEAKLSRWDGEKRPDVEACLSSLGRLLEEGPASLPPDEPRAAGDAPPAGPALDQGAPHALAADTPDRVLRVTADNLNRLLSLAGESLVASRWVQGFAASLGRVKRLQRQTARALDGLRESLATRVLDERAQAALATAQYRLLECQHQLAERLVELEMFDRRSVSLSHRLYDEALACRMRPFRDGVHGLPRLVRDVALSLGKQVRLEIVGEATQVDRDILGKLEAPLGHLVRNAIDHGIETPDARLAAGKEPEGLLRVEARHSAGALHIIVSDDGRGIDLERLRQTVLRRQLIKPEAAQALSEAELLEFLFLPGFTTREKATEISGRGVGLDAVQDTVRQVRGAVRVSSQLGRGTRFQMQLPVTLSVLRALLVNVGGEAYAFPLAYIVRTLKLTRAQVETLEGRPHFECNGRLIGLVTAHQILGTREPSLTDGRLPVVVVGDHAHTYGIVVDRLLGERELVVQPLDAQLGKIKDISAGALLEDGSPVLIVDAEDLLQSVDRLVTTDRPARVRAGTAAGRQTRRKRVLVVDDSLTVRELERKLLSNQGYEVDVAVDGMDGWNAVRAGRFDLVVTDVDMPRMDGIELVTMINKDPMLRSLPVMIVSYKDRDEDRRRGLEAGAAHYLAKGSFQDDMLVQAVVDLIGEAAA